MREDLRKELEEKYADRRAENERTEALRTEEIRVHFPAIQRLTDWEAVLFQPETGFLSGHRWRKSTAGSGKS